MSSDVTVAIPAHNAGLTIERAINSVINQSDCSLVLVDDGSSDDTAEKAKGIAGHRLNLVSLKNKMGVGFARKEALKKVKTPFLFWLDADDAFSRKRMSLMLSDIRSKKVDILFDDAVLFCGKTGDFIRDLPVPDFIKTNKGIVRVFERNYLPGPNWMCIKTEVARSVDYDPSFRYAEDVDFILRSIFKRISIGFSEHSGYHQYAYDGSTSRNIDLQKSYCRKALMKYSYDDLFSLFKHHNYSDVSIYWSLLSISIYREEYSDALSFLECIKDFLINEKQSVHESCEKYYFYRGTVLLLLGREKNALSVFSSIKNFDTAEVLNNAGVCYRVLDFESQAQALFKKAIKIFPEYVDAHQNIQNKHNKKITTHTLRVKPSRCEYLLSTC